MSDWKIDAALYAQQGKGPREISRLLDVPYTTVQNYLSKTSDGKTVKSCVARFQNPTPHLPMLRWTEPVKNDIVRINTDITKQGPTIIYIPDSQVKPDTDTEYLRCIGEYIAYKKPDVIVCAGDFADMPSLSSYDKGKKSAEGKRVALDIQASINGMNVLLSPIKAAQAKDPSWKPRMTLTLGNHECLKPDVDVLTKRGFVNITQVLPSDYVAQMGDEGQVVWNQPLGFIAKHYDGRMISWKGSSLSLTCTENHRVYRKTSAAQTVVSLAKDVPTHFEIFSALNNASSGVSLTDDEIRLGAWLCTDSHFTQGKQVVLYQRESNAHKIQNLLDSLGVEYSKRIRNRDIKEICGKMLKKPCEAGIEFYFSSSVAHALNVFDNLSLPAWAQELNDSQWGVFLEILIEADGSIPTRASASRVFYGKFAICSNLQEVAVTKGWSASLTEYREGHWRVNLNKRTSRRQEGSTVRTESHYTGMVHCLEMPLGNLVIRDQWKVHVTGNCRIDRHVEANPEMEGFLSIADLRYEDSGWEVVDFLKPVVIGGVTFIHYWPHPMTGKPMGGSALNVLKSTGCSVVQGHRQTLDVATRTLHTGVQQWSIIAGASYDFDESYKGFTGNKHHRGIVVMHNVEDGGFSPLFIDIEYLKKRFK